MSQDILPDDLPAKTIHVHVAFIAVLVLSALFYWLDVLVIHEIVHETAKAPVGESDWSRQLSIVRAVLENLIAGAWAALLLALMFRWIVALVDPRERVIEVGPTSISERLRSNARNTNNYIFIGNTATFVTSTILPMLVEFARQSGVPRVIDLYIIDPMDLQSVTSYAAFKTEVSRSRFTVASQEIGRWIQPTFAPQIETNDQVVSKLVAAVYLAAYAAAQTQVELRVHLRRSFTPFRADISDVEVVLTQESSDEPAVAFAERGVFYRWYQKEAKAQRNQATTIDLYGCRNKLLQMHLAHPTAGRNAVMASIVKLIKHFPHLAQLSATPQILSMAVDRVLNPTHAY